MNESASAQRSLCTPLRLPSPSQTCWQMSSEDDNEVTLMFVGNRRSRDHHRWVSVRACVFEQFFEYFAERALLKVGSKPDLPCLVNLEVTLLRCQRTAVDGSSVLTVR